MLLRPEDGFHPLGVVRGDVINVKDCHVLSSFLSFPFLSLALSGGEVVAGVGALHPGRRLATGHPADWAGALSARAPPPASNILRREIGRASCRESAHIAA